MADKRVTLSKTASGLLIQLTAQRDNARAAYQSAEATYNAVLDAIAAEHDMTEQGTVEVADGLVTLVMPLPAEEASNGI